MVALSKLILNDSRIAFIILSNKVYAKYSRCLRRKRDNRKTIKESVPFLLPSVKKPNI